MSSKVPMAARKMGIDETRQVTNYVIAYFGGGARTKRPYDYRAVISLYDDITLVGAIHFHDLEDTIPETDHLPADGILGSHLLMRDFPNIVDLLRNEAPIFMHRVARWPTMAVITTEKELVGEGELWAHHGLHSNPGAARR